jgi:hypothetical protein
LPRPPCQEQVSLDACMRSWTYLPSSLHPVRGRWLWLLFSSSDLVYLHAVAWVRGEAIIFRADLVHAPPSSPHLCCWAAAGSQTTGWQIWATTQIKVPPAVHPTATGPPGEALWHRGQRVTASAACSVHGYMAVSCQKQPPSLSLLSLLASPPLSLESFRTTKSLDPCRPSILFLCMEGGYIRCQVYRGAMYLE